jgi:hypothetical protein
MTHKVLAFAVLLYVCNKCNSKAALVPLPWARLREAATTKQKTQG